MWRHTYFVTLSLISCHYSVNLLLHLVTNVLKSIHTKRLKMMVIHVSRFRLYFEWDSNFLCLFYGFRLANWIDYSELSNVCCILPDFQVIISAIGVIFHVKDCKVEHDLPTSFHRDDPSALPPVIVVVGPTCQSQFYQSFFHPICLKKV